MNEFSKPTDRLHSRGFFQPQQNSLRFTNVWPRQTCLSQLFLYVGNFKELLQGRTKTCFHQSHKNLYHQAFPQNATNNPLVFSCLAFF